MQLSTCYATVLLLWAYGPTMAFSAPGVLGDSLYQHYKDHTETVTVTETSTRIVLKTTTVWAGTSVFSTTTSVLAITIPGIFTVTTDVQYVTTTLNEQQAAAYLGGEKVAIPSFASRLPASAIVYINEATAARFTSTVTEYVESTRMITRRIYYTTATYLTTMFAHDYLGDGVTSAKATSTVTARPAERVIITKTKVYTDEPTAPSASGPSNSQPDPHDVPENSTLDDDNASSNSLPMPTVLGISTGCTVFAVLLAVIIILCVKWHKRKKQRRQIVEDMRLGLVLEPKLPPVTHQPERALSGRTISRRSSESHRTFISAEKSSLDVSEKKQQAPETTKDELVTRIERLERAHTDYNTATNSRISRADNPPSSITSNRKFSSCTTAAVSSTIGKEEEQEATLEGQTLPLTGLSADPSKMSTSIPVRTRSILRQTSSLRSNESSGSGKRVKFQDSEDDAGNGDIGKEEESGSSNKAPRTARPHDLSPTDTVRETAPSPPLIASSFPDKEGTSSEDISGEPKPPAHVYPQFEDWGSWNRKGPLTVRNP